MSENIKARWYVLSADGFADLCSSEAEARELAVAFEHNCPEFSPHRAVQLVDASEVDRLRETLTELRDRIKNHPAYADLTEAQEMEVGGDTAELSYLARVCNAALGPNV